MIQKILLVDDDPLILEAYQRALRNRFEFRTALGTSAALKLLEEEGPFAVLVSDMRMPGLDGLELLKLAQEMDPDLIRIMLTGNVDQRTAIDAINEGRVFRFLTKPCGSEELAMAMRDGLRQREVLAIERELMEQTVGGMVGVLTDLIASLEPETLASTHEARRLAEELAGRMHVRDAWEVGLAAQFARIGELTLSRELREKLRSERELTASERGQALRVPELGEHLLARIPRLGGVARIIRYQAKGYDGSGFPSDGVREGAIPMGARILRPVLDLLQFRRMHARSESAMEDLLAREHLYDAEVLAHLVEVLVPVDEPLPSRLRVAELKVGMTLGEDVVTTGGRLVLSAGARLGTTHLLMLQNLRELLDLVEPIQVYED